MIARGTIWRSEFGAATDEGRDIVRPALVVSADDFNRSRLRTVVVVTLTSNLARAGAPGNVLLEVGDSGLDRTSVVNVTQLFTLDRSRLVEQIGALSTAQMWLVSEGLRRSLAL